jgi:hypothetical protein
LCPDQNTDSNISIHFTDAEILDAGDKVQLTEFRDLLVSARDKATALKKPGKPLDEIVTSKATAVTDVNWGGFFIPPKFFAELVYQGV